MRKGDFSASAADNAAFCGTGKPWVMCPLGKDLTGTLPDGSTVPASGIISPGLFDRGGKAMLGMIPAPNADPTLTPGGVNYILPYTTNQNGWILHSRVDYNVSERTKLYVSYNTQRETDQVPVHLWWQPANSVPFPGGMSSRDTSHTVSAHLLQIAGPSLTNELVGTLAYVNFPLAPDDPSRVSRAKLDYPYKGIYDNGDPMLPSLSNGYWTPQPMMDQPDLFYPGGNFVWKKLAPTFEDNLSKVYRAHTLKFGFYFERTANDQGSWSYTNGEALYLPWGSYTNNTALNMLLGRPSEFWENNFQAVTNMSYKTYAAYAMDHWNLNRRLSLTLGARFEHLTGWYDDDRKTRPCRLEARSIFRRGRGGSRSSGCHLDSARFQRCLGPVCRTVRYSSPLDSDWPTTCSEAAAPSCGADGDFIDGMIPGTSTVARCSRRWIAAVSRLRGCHPRRAWTACAPDPLRWVDCPASSMLSIPPTTGGRSRPSTLSPFRSGCRGNPHSSSATWAITPSTSSWKATTTIST